MSIEIQCMTEKLIVITIKLDYSKVPSKSTCPLMPTPGIYLVHALLDAQTDRQTEVIYLSIIITHYEGNT